MRVVEGVIRLNRFGLEQRKLLPALLMALAVLAPIITWVTANNLIPGQEELPKGETIELAATAPPLTPPGNGVIEFKVPSQGWTLETSKSSTDSVTLVYSPMVLTVEAVAGVEDLTRLFNRQKRGLADNRPAYFVTEAKALPTDKGLSGLWGDLTGERYGGALVVVGKGTVAAVVTVTAPLGRLDGELNDVRYLLDSMEITK